MDLAEYLKQGNGLEVIWRELITRRTIVNTKTIHQTNCEINNLDIDAIKKLHSDIVSRHIGAKNNVAPLYTLVGQDGHVIAGNLSKNDALFIINEIPEKALGIKAKIYSGGDWHNYSLPAANKAYLKCVNSRDGLPITEDSLKFTLTGLDRDIKYITDEISGSVQFDPEALPKIANALKRDDLRTVIDFYMFTTKHVPNEFKIRMFPNTDEGINEAFKNYAPVKLLQANTDALEADKIIYPYFYLDHSPNIIKAVTLSQQKFLGFVNQELESIMHAYANYHKIKFYKDDLL